ncbi:hypothetical protein [Bacillus sp. BHET2]|nr:hypothetical protein [Bacillus sp. BHET2]
MMARNEIDANFLSMLSSSALLLTNLLNIVTFLSKPTNLLGIRSDE